MPWVAPSTGVREEDAWTRPRGGVPTACCGCCAYSFSPNPLMLHAAACQER